MWQDILGSTILFGLVIVISIFIDSRKSVKYWYILILFFTIGIIDNLFHTVTNLYPDTQIIKSFIFNNNLIFNWSAKTYSIIFALILWILLRKIISTNDIGLRFKQNKGSIKFSLLFMPLFLALAALFGLISNRSEFNLNPLFYSAIMPGLAEELIYRGILLGLLNKIFEKNFKVLGTYFGWGAILTSIVFGLLHGFQLTENFHADFYNVPNMVLTGIYGFIFALMKERSGSLVFPVIGHSAADFFIFLFRMI